MYYSSKINCGPFSIAYERMKGLVYSANNGGNSIKMMLYLLLM